MSSLLNVAVFLIETIFTLYMVLILLRLLSYQVSANFREPLIQLVVHATNPVLRPLHRFIPAWRRIDLAALLVLFVVMSIKISLIWVLYGATSSLYLLPIAALLNTFYLILQFFFFSILIGAIASLIVSRYDYNSVLELLFRINELLLYPVRSRLQPMYGIDFSPFIVLIILQIAMILLGG